MAESEMMVRSSPPGVAHGRGGMGILRLLRRWPADQARAGDSAEHWPEAEFQPARAQPESAAATSPHLVIDRRATTLALRQTIDEWRTAQRELEGLAIGSRDRALTQAKAELLRMQHHRLFVQLNRAAR